ncbi:MAG: lamin tail domain-containing protein [Deltaproteobacteria bacterium]
MWWRIAILVAGISGCEWGGGSDFTGNLVVPDAKKSADARKPDAPPVPIDAPPDSATMQGSGHLLLTEVALGGAGAEFIELANPTTQAVDLSHYYLSDNGNYWKLPVGTASVGLSQGDFIAQFPAGAMLAAGAVITVATGTAAAFTTAYGAAPSYSIADATITVTASSGTPGLTDGGELVVLFVWDGASALVKDVDMMLAGSPTPPNGLVSKSGVTQLAGTYAADADTIANQPSAPAAGTSTKRIAAETGHEIQAGTGNGLTGHDETSEATSATWDTTFTAPTPGSIPAF